MNEPLHYQSLAETCRQIKSGARSSMAVTEATLQRIAELDGELKSFVMVLAEQALARAAELDQMRTDGQPLGPLHGVPIAIKDLLFTAGLPTASGTIVMRDYRPRVTATVINKLVDAGAVLIGKTQLTEGAFGVHHPRIAPPQNPYDRALWPGVSSSGSGVAVAAGLAYAALGSDTGGSIRFPSACCGLVGIKPTYGRVSRYGAFPLAESLDHIGPMARTVEDAARVLAVIAGYDEHDPTSLDLPVPNYAAAGAHGEVLRVGVDWQYVEEGVEPQIVAAVRAAADGLAAQGVEIVPVSMPAGYRELVRNWGLTTGVECARAHVDYYPRLADQYGPALRSLIELGRRVDMADYEVLQQKRVIFARELDQTLSGLAGLLIPNMPVLPQPVATMEAGYDDSAHAPFITFTAPFDYSGHPTLTVPTGLNDRGLPDSVQLVGHRLDEATLIQLGYLLEAHRGPMPHPADPGVC